MSMKKNWVSPTTTLEVFLPNAYIAACDTQTVEGTMICSASGTELTAVSTRYAAGTQSVYGSILNKKYFYQLNAENTDNVGAGGVLYEEFSYTENGKAYYAYNGQMNDSGHGDSTNFPYNGEAQTGNTAKWIPEASAYVYSCPDCGFISGTANANHHHVEFGYKVIANPS